MRVFSLGLLVAMLALSSLGNVHAQSTPQFRLGFKTLADQLPLVVGEPLEDEHHTPNGDALQQTTTGLMVWRKADNWTAFTNGWWTWIDGPNGLQDRANSDRFGWESAAFNASQSTPSDSASGGQSSEVNYPAGFSAADGSRLDNAVEIQYYDVRGSTAGELSAQLASSPCGEGKWGTTSWRYTVTFSRRSDGSVSVQQGGPLYHISILLPRWKAPSSAPPSLVDSWRRMVAALEAHERKHADIAIAGLGSMRSAIESTHGLEEAEAARRAVQLRIEQDEAYYDWVTDHGSREGVTFP